MEIQKIMKLSQGSTHALDYEQSPFFLSPSSKTCETRKRPRALLKARDWRGRKKEKNLRWPEPIYIRVGYIFESRFSPGMIKPFP